MAKKVDVKNAYKKLTFKFVLRQTPYAFLYFVIGSLFGALTSFVLFNLNKELLMFILDAWFKRLMFGLTLFGTRNYTLWFVVNNIIALLLVIVASVLIMVFVIKGRTRFRTWKFDRFRKFETRRPKITLYGIYIVPIGALMINGFLVSLFAVYIFLDAGMSHFIDVLMLLLPHGINELIALVLASSLGLSYIKILSPLILARRWDECIETGKKFLSSNVTLFFMIIIAILIVFSGFIEGAIGLFAFK